MSDPTTDPSKPATFHLRPAQIEAMQVLGGEDGNVPSVLAWILSAGGRAVDCRERGTQEHGVVVETPTGNRTALPEQWVIHHGGGRFDVLGWSEFDGLYEAGAVPGTPAATTTRREESVIDPTTGEAWDPAALRTWECCPTCGSGGRPVHMPVGLPARPCANPWHELAALSPVPGPGDTARREAADAWEIADAALSPAPGNEPDGAEVSAADLAGILTLAADLGTESWHEMAQHLKRRYEIRERAASVAQEGGGRG